MKNKGIALAIIAMVLVVFAGCSSKKSVTKGAREVELPFSSKEFQTDKDNFRARNYGKSPDLATAKKIALQNAKSEIASSIQTTIKNVTDQYTNQRQVGNATEFESKFEELSRSVVNQKLSDIRIIGEKTFQEQDNSYTYWVAIEINKQSLIEGMNNQIGKDQKLQLDFDKYKYEEIFNKEMDKFQQGQQ